MGIRRARKRRPIRRFVVVLALVGIAAIVLATPARADWIRNKEYWLTDYGFTTAWNTTQGAGVVVSVIDSGIANVSDLDGAVIGGADFSGVGSADGRTPIGELDVHGTLVASILAGRGTGPNSGVIGTAPAASLLSASVAFGDTTRSADDQIAEAVRWSVDQGATVINMSLTRNSLEWPASWDDAFLYAFEHDVVIVAAAGNRGSGTEEVGAPATIPGVLTVAGVDANGEASYDASSQGITIAVAAPSEELIGLLPNGQETAWAGSSGATPIVAGLVALVRAAHPDLDANNVINRIIKTATPVDSAPSPIYGFGLINADAAVNAEVPLVKENPLGSLAEWVKLYRRAGGDLAAVPTPTATPLAPVAGWSPPWASPSAYEASLVLVPLAFVVGFGSLVVLGSIAVARQVRRNRDHRDDTKAS